jgi:hypothetical protein
VLCKESIPFCGVELLHAVPKTLSVGCFIELRMLGSWLVDKVESMSVEVWTLSRGFFAFVPGYPPRVISMIAT